MPMPPQSYKRKVARFNDGSPAEWIEVLEALVDKIFAQNQENKEDGGTSSITLDMINNALRQFLVMFFRTGLLATSFAGCRGVCACQPAYCISGNLWPQLPT